MTLAGTNQMVRARVRYPTISGNLLAGNNFRFGFGDSVTITTHAVGVYVESDSGVLTLRGASTNGDIDQTITGVSTLTSGTTTVIDTWHDIAIFCEGTNANGGPKTIKCFVDGELGATIENFLMGSTETMEVGFAHWNDDTLTAEWDIDYIEAWLPRN
jgi:hypothetical protein